MAFWMMFFVGNISCPPTIGFFCAAATNAVDTSRATAVSARALMFRILLMAANPRFAFTWHLRRETAGGWEVGLRPLPAVWIPVLAPVDRRVGRDRLHDDVAETLLSGV